MKSIMQIRRFARAAGAVLLACSLAGCPQESGQTVTDDTTTGQDSGSVAAGDSGDSRIGRGNADNPTGSGDGAGKVRVTLHGLSARELSLRASVWIGPRAISRNEAADPSALSGSGFVLSPMQNGDHTVSADVTGEFKLVDGQVMTILAVESEGGLTFHHLPEDLPSEVAPQLEAAFNSNVEFVNFSGPTSGAEPGVAVVLPGSNEIEIVVNYQRMPLVIAYKLGAARADVEIDALPYFTRFGTSEHSQNGTASAYVPAGPDKLTMFFGQLKSGSTVEIRPRKAITEFLRWEGDCEGGDVCTLTFGGATGTQDQVTTAVFAYVRCEYACATCGQEFADCPVGMTCTYSSHTPGAPAGGGNCTIVRP